MTAASTHPTDTTAQTASALTITVTETIVTTYSVTPAQLDQLGLPVDLDGLENVDGDHVATSLEEALDAEAYAVTERELEFSTTQ